MSDGKATDPTQALAKATAIAAKIGGSLLATVGGHPVEGALVGAGSDGIGAIAGYLHRVVSDSRARTTLEWLRLVERRVTEEATLDDPARLEDLIRKAIPLISGTDCAAARELLADVVVNAAHTTLDDLRLAVAAAHMETIAELSALSATTLLILAGSDLMPSNDFQPGEVWLCIPPGNALYQLPRDTLLRSFQTLHRQQLLDSSLKKSGDGDRIWAIRWKKRGEALTEWLKSTPPSTDKPAHPSGTGLQATPRATSANDACG
jgi:hypothetical protein